MASIKYANSFDEQIKLFNLIREKHVADGDKSPLADYNFKELTQHANIAAESDKKSKEYARLSEEKTKDRSIAFDSVQENVRAIGAFLKAKYRNNPKELGKWGFTVIGE